MANNNNNKKKSFFEEKRLQSNNPNFFKHMPVDEIKRNVKRIIKDIKFDNIKHQDYQYFTNPNVLMCCYQEALQQWRTASVTANALSYYINNVINGNMCPPGIDPLRERIDATNEHVKYTTKASLWLSIYKMFDAIYNNNAPIEATLSNIRNMKFNINDLG